MTEEYSKKYKGIDNLYDYILILYILLLIEKRFNLYMILFNILRIIRENLLKTYVLKNIFLGNSINNKKIYFKLLNYNSIYFYY